MKKQPEDIFREHGGQLRMSEAIRHGITRYMLYTLRDNGIIEQVSRGLYRLVELPPISNPDLVMVSHRFSKAVICLISALSYYNITTQIPHVVSIALPRNSRRKILGPPPIRVHRFSAESYSSGIEKYEIDKTIVQIYSPEKTLADCFKYRNRIGMDVTLEALKLYKTRMNFNTDKLLKYASICRVKNVMLPYLEATI